MMTSHSTRRQFVKRTALAGAGAFGIPYFVPSRVLGEDAPSKQLVTGHIGVGGRGTADMGAFLGQRGCRVLAVSDCFKSRRERAKFRVDKHNGNEDCRMYADFRELCADPDLDVVVVTTPDHWHVLAALEAVRNGKHVYVEKPLGLSIEQDQTLREEIQRYGVKFQYGTQQRSQQHMRWVCEMVINGRLGKLKAVEVVCPGGAQGGSTEPLPVPEDLDYDRFLGPAPEAPYTKDRCTSSGSYHISDFALGFIAGWGAHPLDIMVWGLGDTAEATPVEYSGTGIFPTTGLFDTALRWDVRGRFADGKAFRFQGPGGDRTTFIGERGTLAVSRGGIRTIEPASLKDEKLGPGDKRLHVSTNQAGDLLDAIRNDRPTVSPVHVACWSDFVSHLSDLAIRTGETLRWDPVNEQILDNPAAARLMVRATREPWCLT